MTTLAVPSYDQRLALYVDGEWREGASGQVHHVVDPATEETIGSLSLGSAQDVDDALAAATRGFATWKRTPAVERARVLERCAVLLRERGARIGGLMCREHGKLLGDGVLEATTSADIVKWFAEEGRRAYGRVVPGALPHSRQLVMKVPVGPVAAFTPWNFPVRIPARTIAGALAAGCSVVLKAAEETPASTIALVQCFHDAGLPAGVLNLVFGEPDLVSRRLIGSREIRAVAFTGSVTVGKHLLRLAADGVKKVVMELGGHAPLIVCDDLGDAAIDRLARMTASAKFRSGGQACISATRFYVQRAVYDRFVERFVETADRLVVGPGHDPATQACPLANGRRVRAMDALVADAVGTGATLLAGGHRLDRPGYFYAPTVFGDVPEHARLMNEEPFGPVVPFAPFETVDEVLTRANRLDAGLAAYAFTTSDRRALQLSEELEAGMIGINSMSISGPELPFGGVKESGIGSENGIEGLQAYLVTKCVQQAVLTD